MLSNKLRSRKSELDDLEKQESELLSKMQNTVASHSAMSKLYEETKKKPRITFVELERNL